MSRKKKLITIVSVLVVCFNLYIILHHNPLDDRKQEIIKKIVSCVILDGFYFVFVKLYDRIVVLPIELYQNRKLIWKLAKNDFKTKYAGSYFGVFWGFVPPIITVLLYWFVFGVVMPGRATNIKGDMEIPYILWLIVGIVPWFYFSEAISSGTNALLEYNYLVKKVVFKISILPIIKIVSALFVHAFFIVFTLILLACYGYYPDLYTLQLIYYSFCMFMFVLGLSYITCSLIVFFRDLGQMIAIALQVGIWATPILWNLHLLDDKPVVRFIIKLNPMTYVVEGYRSAIFDKLGFYETFYSTAYFWILTAITFGVGALVFKRLKVHFADVL